MSRVCRRVLAVTTLMIDAGPVASAAQITRTGGVPLAPAGTAWPCCTSCEGPMQFLAQVVLDDLRGGFEGRGILALFACQNDPGMCGDWEPDSGGNQAVIFPTDGAQPLPQPDGVDEELLLLGSVRAVSPVHVDESDYGKAGEEWSAGSGRSASSVLGQLGGDPAWIQNDETPSCPSCAAPMPLVVQLEEGPDHSTAMNFGGCGSAYAFACAPCGRAKFLWQC
ncbi:DUF1963 domain-containing protein [Streptomyces sp. NPDC102406]|uniref:DUF1963 domain-containing protein n=1 Tax=Streptomyces sp. NPDC102406 TaxID=3366171 RepID=UPI00381B2E67